VKNPLRQINPLGKLTLPTIAEEIATLKTAVIAASAAVFEWTLADDSIIWEGALDILPGPSIPGYLDSGRALLELLSPQSRNKLTGILEGEATGGDSFKLEIEMASALGSLWYNLSAMRIPGSNGVGGHITGLLSEITEQRGQMQRLEYLAARDELTGLLNRNSLRAEFERNH